MCVREKKQARALLPYLAGGKKNLEFCGFKENLAKKSGGGGRTDFLLLFSFQPFLPTPSFLPRSSKTPANESKTME